MDEIPVGLSQLPRRCARRAAGVRDEDVDTPEPVDGLTRHALAVVRARHVGLDRLRLHAMLA